MKQFILVLRNRFDSLAVGEKEYIGHILKNEVKVKFSLEEAMKARRRIDTALLLHTPAKKPGTHCRIG